MGRPFASYLLPRRSSVARDRMPAIAGKYLVGVDAEDLGVAEDVDAC
jgi:hypothetical protein